MADDFAKAGFQQTFEDGTEVLSIRPQLLKGPLAAARTVYEIRGRVTLSIREGIALKDTDELTISKIESIAIRTGVISQATNAHDIVFRTDGGREYVWRNVPKAKAVKELVQSIIEQPQASGSAGQASSRTDTFADAGRSTSIPNTPKLSSRVLTFPSLSNSVFDRALWVTNPRPDHSRPLVERYQWVKQGDPLEAIYARASRFFSDLTAINLRSPVSGMTLSASVFDGRARILLPEGAAVPHAAGELVYRELCDFCDKNRAFLYHQGEIEGRYTDERLTELFQVQRAFSDFEIKPLDWTEVPSIAMKHPHTLAHLKAMFEPTFQERIDEELRELKQYEDEQQRKVRRAAERREAVQAFWKPKWLAEHQETLLYYEDRLAALKSGSDDPPPFTDEEKRIVGYTHSKSGSVYDDYRAYLRYKAEGNWESASIVARELKANRKYLRWKEPHMMNWFRAGCERVVLEALLKGEFTDLRELFGISSRKRLEDFEIEPGFFVAPVNKDYSEFIHEIGSTAEKLVGQNQYGKTALRDAKRLTNWIWSAVHTAAADARRSHGYPAISTNDLVATVRDYATQWRSDWDKVNNDGAARRQECGGVEVARTPDDARNSTAADEHNAQYEGGAADDMNDEFRSTSQSNRREEGRAADDACTYPPDVEALRVKWGLKPAYTKNNLNDACEKRYDKYPEGMAQRIRSEYETLESHVTAEAV